MTHKPALVVVAIAGTLDVIAGLVFAAVEHLPVLMGLYWAVATATTVGYGDVIPRTVAGRITAVVVMLTVVPLFAATFSLFTSGLTSTRVRKHILPHTEATRRIVADIYHDRTGQHHPDAPHPREL